MYGFYAFIKISRSTSWVHRAWWVLVGPSKLLWCVFYFSPAPLVNPEPRSRRQAEVTVLFLA